MVVPNSTSKTPGSATCPETAKRRMPRAVSLPMAPKADPPLTMIQGRFDSVSTLLTIVGWP